MHTWHDDFVDDLARALMALPPDHPAILALPPGAAEALAWLLREHGAETEREEARARRPLPDYGLGIDVILCEGQFTRVIKLRGLPADTFVRRGHDLEP